MVLEEGLDTSTLPDTLREDFEQLDRFEGQYRVTSFLIKVVNLEPGLSPRKGPPCVWCNVKEVESMRKTILEEYNPIIRLSKVTVFN